MDANYNSFENFLSNRMFIIRKLAPPIYEMVSVILSVTWFSSGQWCTKAAVKMV
jgi:hypothetical protein